MDYTEEDWIALDDNTPDPALSYPAYDPGPTITDNLNPGYTAPSSSWWDDWGKTAVSIGGAAAAAGLSAAARSAGINLPGTNQYPAGYTPPRYTPPASPMSMTTKLALGAAVVVGLFLVLRKKKES
jgi:hypothetical protein